MLQKVFACSQAMCPSTQARLRSAPLPRESELCSLAALLFLFFGNIPLSLLWLEESDCKNEEGEELNNRHRSVRRSSVRWSSSSLLYYVGHMRASMIYHRFICAPRSVRACDPDEKNWADRSIQRSAAMKRRGRPTDRPTDVRFGLGILQSWLGSLHAIKKVHCGKGW